MAVNFDKLMSVFQEAVEHHPPEEWDGFVQKAAGGDEELYRQACQLLHAHAHGDSRLDKPAVQSPTIDQSITEKPGTRIGPYKLLQQLGEGGMGVVYMAEQQAPVKRRVALKIIKPGMDTGQVIARFEAERQALAMMDHPNIARVMDAGTTDSERPFFAMELVKGIPITQYCDERQLTIRQRLGLFADVCHAIQHAHQKGIIHRDLKPSNVLVAEYDDRPVAKVIDFGVAKAIQQQLTERTMFTQVGQVVGTLEYMSPEQAKLNELDVDTRSDIYSLGVLLYELLAGETPFDRQRLRSAAFDEMLRILREEEPPRPSMKVSTSASLPSIAAKRHVKPGKLSVLVRGELDWIVMKAMEKDRSRRYDTANALASDIANYLNDDAVVACPPSAAYRCRKFARRNKAALATGSLIAAALLAGVAGTVWQATRAKAERDVAVEAKQLADEQLQRALTAEEAAREGRRLEVNLRQEAERRGEEVTGWLAASHVDYAQALCEQGEIGRGLLWFAHSLQVAPNAATELQRAVRTNLAAWASQLHSLTTVAWMDGEVRAVGLSHDGSQFMTGSADGTIRLWNAASGQMIHEARGHDHTVLGVAFSPDGSRVATAARGGTVRLWNCSSLSPSGEPLPGGHPVFAPEGRRLWIGRSGVVSSYEVTTGELVERHALAEGTQRQSIKGMGWTTDGLRAVVTIARGTHQLWDVEQEEAVGPPVKHSDVLIGAVHPDGTRFATAGYGSRIHVWDAAKGESAMEPLNHGGVVTGVVFSADGKRLVSGANDRAARLWDLETGDPIGVPMRHGGEVLRVAISRDGRQILTGCQDGTARLWSIASDNTSGQPIQHPDRVVGAAFAADGLRIVTERRLATVS